MNAEIISTGSKGNAVLLNGSVLIDCGVPWRIMKPWAGQIKAVLLTHAHTDHFLKSTIKRLAFEHPGVVFATPPELLGSVYLLGIPPRQIIPCEMNTLTAVGGGVIVTPLPLVHDVPNVAWIVSAWGEKALYATDTQYIPFNAPGLDLYMIEANYSESEILTRMQAKVDAGGFAYESSAFARHMSKEKALAWLADNATEKSRILFLHGHGGNENG